MVTINKGFLVGAAAVGAAASAVNGAVARSDDPDAREKGVRMAEVLWQSETNVTTMAPTTISVTLVPETV